MIHNTIKTSTEASMKTTWMLWKTWKRQDALELCCNIRSEWSKTYGKRASEDEDAVLQFWTTTYSLGTPDRQEMQPCIINTNMGKNKEKTLLLSASHLTDPRKSAPIHAMLLSLTRHHFSSTSCKHPVRDHLLGMDKSSLERRTILPFYCLQMLGLIHPYKSTWLK